MTQENRFTSFTTCGMPLNFKLVEIKTGKIVNTFTDVSFQLVPDYLNKERFAWCQAIGATDNSNLFGISKPKQELYLGDLIEFNLDKKNVVGEIVWLNFSVWVRLWRNENWISYLSMSHVLDYFKIKKLGSRYTKEGEEILRKAGLEGK